MKKLILVALVLFCSSIIFSQQNILIFKKGNRTINTFFKGSTIAFQLEDKEWQKGEITRIQNDSFYIRPMVVRYGLMGTDTTYYNILGFALAEVFAMPKKGLLIDYNNGSFQISMSGGHMHWYWIKSGWIFRAGGLGYIALNVTNGAIKNDFSFRDNNLKVAAGAYLLGAFLKRIYKVTYRVHGQYHFEILNLTR